MGKNPSSPGFSFDPVGSFFKKHGQLCATKLRRHLGLNDNEVVRDVFGAMRSMGFKVFRRRLENSNISGLFMRDPEAGPCILVNLAEGMARQRFSAAHEWGHGLMDDTPIIMSTVSEWTSNELVELRANTFASNFLIPPARLTTIQAQWTNPNVVSKWATHFRVSIPALLFALSAANLIDKEQQEELRQTATRPQDPIDPELERLNYTQISRHQLLFNRGISQDYVHLCFEAFSKKTISFGLLCEMLMSSASGVQEIARLFNRSIYHAG